MSGLSSYSAPVRLADPVSDNCRLGTLTGSEVARNACRSSLPLSARESGSGARRRLHRQQVRLLLALLPAVLVLLSGT
jgi:hypothetical protein